VERFSTSIQRKEERFSLERLRFHVTRIEMAKVKGHIYRELNNLSSETNAISSQEETAILYYAIYRVMIVFGKT